VRVSPNATTAGTASITVNVPNNTTAIPYFVQGIEGTSGSATITITTPGFPTGTHTVTVVAAGIELHGLPTTTTTLSANDVDVYAQVGVPNGPGTAISVVQAVRAGAPAFVFTLNNSNAAVAQLYSDEPVTTGQSVTKPIKNPLYYNDNVLGSTSYGLAFDPLAAGSTTVTVVGPPGVNTMSVNGVRTVGVTAPGITVISEVTVGSGLQLPINATLGGSAHGGVNVTIASSAPNLVRVSPDATTAGTGSITVNVANLTTAVPFYVQGMEGATGATTVTISAPGFLSDSVNVTVVQGGVEIQSLATSIAANAPSDTNFWVQVGIPNNVNTALQAIQNVRAGGPGVVVTLSNSTAAVAQLYSDEPVTTGQVVTKPIDPGTYYTYANLGGTSYGLSFDPIAAGNTTVTVTAPGFKTMTTNGVRPVLVTP
jgi:hypothetical protein